MKSLILLTIAVFLFTPAIGSASETGFQPILLADQDNRQDRRQERGRSDERHDRRDCRQEEGRAGEDKRECKQEEVRDGARGNRDNDDDNQANT